MFYKNKFIIPANIKKHPLSGLVLFFILYGIISILLSPDLFPVSFWLHPIHNYLNGCNLNIISLVLRKALNFSTNLNELKIYLNNSTIICLLPGCSGLTPIIKIIFILIFYPGPIRNKIFYIPISIIILYIATLLHLIILVTILNHNPGMYNFTHGYLTRIFFYIVFFFLWLFWESKMRKETSP